MSALARMRLLAAAFSAAFSALMLDACAAQPCPMISAAAVVTIHVTAQRAATLDRTSFTGQACQDGACHGGPLELRPEGGLGGSPTSSPVGYIAMIQMNALTESPIDLTVSGKDLQGQSIGTSHLNFTPRGTYPWGPQCSRVIIAEATLDDAGLHAP